MRVEDSKLPVADHRRFNYFDATKNVHVKVVVFVGKGTVSIKSNDGKPFDVNLMPIETWLDIVSYVHSARAIFCQNEAVAEAFARQ